MNLSIKSLAILSETKLLLRGVDLIPDILCNGGGVIGSYYEWLQNRRAESWKIDHVLSLLQEKLDASFEKTITAAKEYNTDWRTAAYIVALKRLELTYKERGVFP